MVVFPLPFDALPGDLSMVDVIPSLPRHADAAASDTTWSSSGK